MRLTAKLLVPDGGGCARSVRSFLSWSMTTERLRVSNLSSRTTSRFFILLRRGVISCKPRSKSCGQRGVARDSHGRRPAYPTDVAHLWHRFAVIYIARRELKSQQFTLVIDNQMELEAIEPAHTALASCGHISKDPMPADALVVADRQRGRIDKCHPCRLAQTPIQVEIQGWQGGWHQLHNARVL